MKKATPIISADLIEERNEIIHQHRDLILNMRQIENEIQKKLSDKNSCWKEYRFNMEDGRSGWDIVEDELGFNLKDWQNKSKLYYFKRGELKQ